jgi:hypothetical protein
MAGGIHAHIVQLATVICGQAARDVPHVKAPASGTTMIISKVGAYLARSPRQLAQDYRRPGRPRT